MSLLLTLLIFTTAVSATATATTLATAPSPTHLLGHHHHHHSQAPTPAPAKAPTTHHSLAPSTKTHTQPPAKPPAPAPAYHRIPRKFIGIQGVVYCKNCTYAGVNTLVGAYPLQGATVKVKCNNTDKYELIGKTTSDKHGYFYLKGPKEVTTYGAHKCRAFLTRDPTHAGPCGKPTNLNGGISGGFLILDAKSKYSDQSKSNSSEVYVYDVGPFAYEPIKCLKH